MRWLSLALLLAATPIGAQTTVQTNPVAGLGDLPRQTDLPRQIGASAVGSDAVAVDGRLDEAAWAEAEVATGFVQRRPDPGAAASEPTEARVLYDGGAVYVGVRMLDSEPDAILAPLGRRDSYLEGDWITVGFDSYGDDRTAFTFALNPAGVQRDLLIYDDVREDVSWDAVWDGAVSRDESGWTAEFRIPLSQLRYAGGRAVQEWGLQFHRKHHRTGEEVFWAPLLPDDDGMVSRFGTLADLRDLRAPRQLELVPYVASALTRAPEPAQPVAADPYYAENDLEPRVGLDLKYGLSSDLTLTATVNPDFGQVEADPAQVNLGGFELFFGERRPFFVEGTDVFSMQPRRFMSINRPNLLYTRRIGRQPQRRSFVPGEAYALAGEAGAVYTDAPGQSTILGAAKLSGRVGPFSVGVLNATTAPEYGRFQAFSAGGQLVMDDRALVEPVTNYTVARARGTFGQTVAGGLLTSVARDTGDPAIGGLLPTTATVGGVDVEHRLGDDWVVSGQVAGSVVTGSASSIGRLQTAFPRLYQRPDADHLSVDPTATTLAGLTAEANVLKTGGEHWVGGVHAALTSPGFDANELGFQSRADQTVVGGVLMYQQNQPQGPFQRWNVGMGTAAGTNFAGDRTITFIGSQGGFQTKAFWGGGFGLTVSPRTVADRLTRGGPLATDAAEVSGSVRFYADGRKPVSGNVWAGTVQDELGGHAYDANVGVEARPSDALSFSLSPGLNLSSRPRQYVGTFDAPGLDATFGRRYVFGAIDQTTVSLAARASWTFTPNLSLQLYARPFVTRGQYDGFRQLTAPGQLDFPVYGADAGQIERGRFEEDAEGARVFVPDADATEAYRVTGADGGTATFSNPNFTVRALQGNAVLRWEYRPGSTLFFVWQQQRDGFAPDGALRFDRDVGGLFGDVSTNAFLVKLSYWLG